MKVTITEIDGNEISFVQEGVKELQKFPLASWVKPDYVKLGDAEITITNGEISFCTMSKDVPKKPAKPGPAGTNKSNKWEDDIVTFETLLTKAHAMQKKDGNLFSIKTKMLEVDLEKKFALFKARIEVGSGETMRVFEGHGDATDKNVTGDYIKPHFIRMAETRAIVRALRWYTNNGCAEEEK